MKIFKKKKTDELWRLLEMDRGDKLGYILLARYITGELNEITMKSFLCDYVFVREEIVPQKKIPSQRDKWGEFESGYDLSRKP